jgi:hypothetical protein
MTTNPATVRILAELQSIVEVGDEAVRKFADKLINTDHGALTYFAITYQLSWAQATAEAAFCAQNARRILMHYEAQVADGKSGDEALRRGLTGTSDELTRGLLNNQWRAMSTRAFHDACEGAECAAAVYLLERLARYRHSLDKAAN